jgi:hypothetical protein
MLWLTRSKIRFNRAATGWLVRRFIDPGASFRFVEPAEVAKFQADHGAIGFDAPGARYPHMDPRGRCSFEVLVEEYRPGDAALRELAGIVRSADFPAETAGTGAEQPTAGTGTWDTISLVASVRSLCASPVPAGSRWAPRDCPRVPSDRSR